MGFPHPTVDVPGEWSAIRDELAMLDDSLARELRDALNGVAASSASGHVCATAWVIDPTGQYTLLVLHPDLGWSTPGGHVERHELTRGAALRELEEETGLTRFDVRPLEDRPSFVHVTDREGERPHRHWNVAWTFVADMDAPLSPIESARWWPIDALPDGPADLIEKTAVLVRLLAGA